MQSPRPTEWKSALQSNQGTLWAVLAFVSLGVGVAVLLGMSEKPAKKVEVTVSREQGSAVTSTSKPLSLSFVSETSGRFWDDSVRPGGTGWGALLGPSARSAPAGSLAKWLGGQWARERAAGSFRGQF